MNSRGQSLAPLTPAQRRAQGATGAADYYASTPGARLHVSIRDLYNQYLAQYRNYEAQGFGVWRRSSEFPRETHKKLLAAAKEQANKVIEAYELAPASGIGKWNVADAASECVAADLLYALHPFGSEFNHHFDPSLFSEKG